jgi:hypothetical protein
MTVFVADRALVSAWASRESASACGVWLALPGLGDLAKWVIGTRGEGLTGSCRG